MIKGALIEPFKGSHLNLEEQSNDPQRRSGPQVLAKAFPILSSMSSST